VPPREVIGVNDHRLCHRGLHSCRQSRLPAGAAPIHCEHDPVITGYSARTELIEGRNDLRQELRPPRPGFRFPWC
jgi:hypothetical protein